MQAGQKLLLVTQWKLSSTAWIAGKFEVSFIRDMLFTIQVHITKGAVLDVT